MAEEKKSKKQQKEKVTKIKKNEEEKDIKKISKKENKKTEKKAEKKSLFVRFRIFCHGVKSEFSKVHWPAKKDMVKYSIATVIFVVFCAGFFYLIDVIFALIQSLI